MSKTAYGKTKCFFCGKITSRAGFAVVAHGRKHVREGIAFELNYNHPEFRGVIEFVNLRYRAKVGTIPCTIVFKEPYELKKGKRVLFRYDNENKYMSGIITDIDIPCIFIKLF